MLVVFTSEAHGDFIMFGDVATRLLKMMGHSGTVPGALSADEVPAALVRLRQALESQKGEPAEKTSRDDENDKEPPVTLGLRAFPLIEMLAAAAEAGCHVMWNRK